MASQVEIANYAIIQLGATPISSLEEDSNEAKVIKAIWDQTRRDLLRDHAWNFAIKRANLAQSTTPPGHDYTYRHALPSDLLFAVQVFDTDDYKIEGKFVVSNSPNISLKYVSDIKDVNEFSSDFCTVLSLRIAADIAYSITKSETLSQKIEQVYQMRLSKAKWADTTEDITDDFHFPNTLLTGRY